MHRLHGHPGFNSVTIDYSYMATSHEIPPQIDPNRKPTKTKSGTMYHTFDGQPQWSPDNCEVGLSNTVIFPGDNIEFRGEKVTEPINVITKLRTMSSQPPAEKDGEITWWKWVDPSHLYQTVRWWKQKDHLCLRGIRFQTNHYTSTLISDWESLTRWSETQRQENEVKVIKNWKVWCFDKRVIVSKWKMS